MAEQIPTYGQQARMDALENGSGVSPNLARNRVMGSDQTPVVGASVPRRPQQYPKSGHVRDFADRGRADEHRGGPQLERPQTPAEVQAATFGREFTRLATAFTQSPGYLALSPSERELAFAKFQADFYNDQQPLF